MSTEPPLAHAPVVVGVDGSRAAINAVQWAAAEALALGVCLRLVHVVATPAPDDDVLARALERAEAAAGRSGLQVETASEPGTPGEILLRESRHASMICVGSRPVEDSESESVGPTARALAEAAGCPVAIIRTGRDGSPRTDGVISVVLSDDDDSDAAVGLAMHEGRLRHATVRQIDRRTGSWVRRYPDVHVELVAAGTGRQYTRNELSGNGVGLAVVGRRDAQELAGVGRRNCHPIPGYPDCSLLLVRS
ncbi:universal stress protein [Mycobacterium sp. 4D054]|uniref:universal stress protein n=1 Tax=Mycobacterium sp. 4D054 TaxID=3457440 RepID=UPI003FD600F2